MFQPKIGWLINSRWSFNNNHYSIKKFLILCRQRQICDGYILGPSYFCEIWSLCVSGITYDHFWPIVYRLIYLSFYPSIYLYNLYIYIYIYVYIYIFIYLSLYIYQLHYLHVFSDHCCKWNFCDHPWNILIYWLLQKLYLWHGTFCQTSIYM